MTHIIGRLLGKLKPNCNMKTQMGSMFKGDLNDVDILEIDQW
jgi:hypothetical protein